MWRVLKRIGIGLGCLVGVLLVMQIVPYGWGCDHTNPPVIAEPAWDSPRTRELVTRACFDCHSNQTKWPWYSHVAPTAWVMQHHIDIGRSVLNFSEWNLVWPLAGESSSQVVRREMPPRSYLLLHPEAQLTAEERTDLARGLATTFGYVWRD